MEKEYRYFFRHNYEDEKLIGATGREFDLVIYMNGEDELNNSIEGVFVSTYPLEFEGDILWSKKEEMKNFEEAFEGKFCYFEKD